MGVLARKWTLLVRPDLRDHIMRSRSGDVPLGPERDDMERIVVVPASQLEGAVEAERKRIADYVRSRGADDWDPSVEAALRRVAHEIDRRHHRGGRHADASREEGRR